MSLGVRQVLTLVVPGPDQSGLPELHSQTKIGLVWSMAAVHIVFTERYNSIEMVSYRSMQTYRHVERDSLAHCHMCSESLLTSFAADDRLFPPHLAANEIKMAAPMDHDGIVCSGSHPPLWRCTATANDLTQLQEQSEIGMKKAGESSRKGGFDEEFCC